MFIRICCLLVCVPLLLQASVFSDVSLDTRVAVFIPESKLFRKIYGVGPFYQIVASKKMCGSLEFWSSVSYYTDSGHSTLFKEKTRIQLIPIALGLNYVVPLRCGFQAYAGAGPCYTIMDIHDHSSCFSHRNVTGDGFGALFRLGVTRCYLCWRFGLFADYLLQTIKFKSSDEVSRMDANIGGLLVGISLGREF